MYLFLYVLKDFNAAVGLSVVQLMLQQVFGCTRCIVVLRNCCLHSWLPGWLKVDSRPYVEPSCWSITKTWWGTMLVKGMHSWYLPPPLELVLHIVAHHFIASYMLNYNCIIGYVEVYPVHFTKVTLTERMPVDQTVITVFFFCLNHLLTSLSVVAVVRLHVALFCSVVLMPCGIKVLFELHPLFLDA